MGDSARLEFTVFGDTVNVAARLESMTRTLDSDVVVSRELLARAGASEHGWTPQGGLQLRGRATAIDCLSREGV